MDIFLLSDFSNGLKINVGHIYLNMTLNGNDGWSASYNFPLSFQGWANIQCTPRNQSEIVLGAVFVDGSTFNLIATNHSDEPRYIYGIWYLAIGV